MSQNDDYLRQQTQERVRSNPGMETVTEQQVPNYQDRLTINNEIERTRREDDERRRQQGG